MPAPRRKDIIAKSPLLRRLKRNINKMKHTLDELVAASNRRDARRKRAKAQPAARRGLAPRQRNGNK